MTQLVCVLVLQSEHSGSSVQLLAKHFICLAESIKFTSQIGILVLQYSRMLLKRFFFSGQVCVSISVLAIYLSLVFNVTSDYKQSFLLVFSPNFSISDLHLEFTVAAILKLNFFSSLEILCTQSFVISFQSTTLSSLLVDLLPVSTDVTLTIFKSNLFVP